MPGINVRQIRDIIFLLLDLNKNFSKLGWFSRIFCAMELFMCTR